MEPNPHLGPHELDFVPPIQQFSHLSILLRLKLWPLTFRGQFAECEWKQNFIAKKTSYSDLDSQRWYKSPWIHLIWKHEAQTFAMNENRIEIRNV